MQQTNEQNQSQDGEDDEPLHTVQDFLLSHPEIDNDDVESTRLPQHATTKSEVFDAIFSPFHLLSALLARDKTFASTIGSQPIVKGSVIELIDDRFTALIDTQYVV